MNTRKSIEFISWLRGVACLIVMVSHHVGMFTNNDVSAVFSYILPKVQAAPRTSVGFISAFQTYFIKFGAFGVAVFFIITGFVTAMSLSEKEYRRGVFFLTRAVRIWPAYLAGLAFLFLTTRLYTGWAETEPPALSYYLVQGSLIRDLLWWPSVDGIGWTLEVQVKMYLAYFLLHKLGRLRSPKHLIGISFIGMLLVLLIKPNLEAALACHMRLYVLLYLICFTAVFIVLGCVGIALYRHYSGEFSTAELSASLLAILTFSAMMSGSFFGEVERNSYFMASAMVIGAYLLRDSVKCGRTLGFISKISYSLYIVHGLSGYYLLSVLDHYGINPYLSLLITFAAAIAAAYALWRFVEKPCAQCSKWIGRSSADG